MRASNTLTLALAAVATIAASVGVTAHRIDEYLQAARFGIDPDRVELQLDLTPGVAIIDSIVSEIDRNSDGTISSIERDAYVGAVLADLSLSLDGRALRLDPAASTFPDLDALRRGEGVIQLRATASLSHVSNGVHNLAFKNMHRRDLSVYLANALVPSDDRVAINAQHRDEAQADLTIEYTLRGNRAPSKPIWPLGLFAAMAALSVVLIRPLLN